MPEVNSTLNFNLEINFWWPHPKIISSVKLDVEFNSGIRILFKQFMSEKNYNVFGLINFYQCMLESEKFSEF